MGSPANVLAADVHIIRGIIISFLVLAGSFFMLTAG